LARLGTREKFRVSGSLGDNLPDVAEIVHPKGFSCGRKCARLKDDEIEGHEAARDAPNVEIFEPGAYFTSIPTTRGIGAVEGGKIGQHIFNTPGKANGHTLDPTKHPPGIPNPCKFHFDAFFFDPSRFGDPVSPKADDAKTIQVVDDAKSTRP